MTSISARDLTVGDVCRLVICVEVIAVTPIAGTKQIKIKAEVEDQGHRSYAGNGFVEGPSTLEFLDTGHVLEFVCSVSRKFRVLERDDWDDDDGDDVDAPTPRAPVTAE